MKMEYFIICTIFIIQGFIAFPKMNEIVLPTKSEITNTSSKDASELEITCSSELNGTVEDASLVRYRGMPGINAQTADVGQIIDAN